ncbi:MAG: type II toxin-antitoxin system prevent-host-death family antitoxin [Pseudomonadota bacterium]
MKTVAAKEAKNRFGQLIDDAQRGPVTIEKNGRPFAVVQSYEDFQESEKAKMEALRVAITEARELYDQGLGKRLDNSALESMKSKGRRILAARTSEQG